jgi:uncharacterized cupin superfamily protein
VRSETEELAVDHPNVVNESKSKWGEQSHGESFGYRRKILGTAAHGEKIGCSLYEVSPGRKTWPYHYHLANEEAIYILEGSGTLRIGRREVTLSGGITWRYQQERRTRTRSPTPQTNCCATSASRRWQSRT